MNLTSPLASKGQVTIPAAARAVPGLRQGNRVDFVETAQGFVIAPATSSIRQLKGIVPKPFIPVSIDDMNDAIAFS